MLPAYAEIFLLCAACAILLIDLYVDKWRGDLTFVLSLAALAGAAFCTLLVNATTEAQVAYTFNGMFVSDLMASVLKIATYLTVAVGFVYSRSYLIARGMYRGEYFALTLFATLGMMVMISANHFLTLYLGLELLSLCLYSLVALNRDSAQSTEAAMKYFVLGALASGMLLYGMSMIYGATGSLEIPAISRSLQAGIANKTILIFGLVFIVSGVAFKLGVVPFHMWIPDVYHGAPTAMTLLIGTAPKLAAFAMAMRLLVGALLPLAIDWQQMLVILAVLSMAVGNLAAIAQTNIKRMLAYSTISHMGFALLGLLSGVVGGNALSTTDAYSSAMFYVLTYVITSLAAFGMVLLLSRAGHEAEELDDYRGLNQRSPWYAFMMLLIMFSLAGVPPTVGFYGKFSVLSAVVQTGQIWLAVVAVIFSLIGAFYYLRIVKLMYFDEPRGEFALAPRMDMGVLLSLNGAGVLILGLFPGPLMQLCLLAIRGLVAN
ncbi:MAG: NADH-quinone oxidoreductase subunit NuoN [Burkholderiales bacterium]